LIFWGKRNENKGGEIMKRMTLLLLLLATALLFSSGATEVNKYEIMIQAITEWLDSKESPVFESADKERIFEWKVALEKTSYGERFYTFSTILDEVGDNTFRHDYYYYNASSLRAEMLKLYPKDSERRPEVEEPSLFLEDMYNYYLRIVSSEQEQMLWLENFMRFLEGLSNKEALDVFKKHPQIIEDILLQYLALAKIFLDGRESDLWDIDNVYKATTTLVANTELYRNYLFNPLLLFVQSPVFAFLSKKHTDTIISFIIPDYTDIDTAVKIYVELTE